MNPIQEERFEYKGFPCVILFMPMCYRCGYVGLPKDMTVNTDKIDCHCGITYTGSHLHLQKDTDRFWIGFDCGHCFDGFDVATARKLYVDDADVLKQIEIMGAAGYFSICNKENPIRTLEYCKEQCKKIVDQILGKREEIK